jgi:predicted GIY-YIG superfamily endonuclease
MYFTYIIETIEQPKHWYVGSTEDTSARLADHNAGRSPPYFEVSALAVGLVLCVSDPGQSRGL